MKAVVVVLGCAAAMLIGACETAKSAAVPAFDPQFARALNTTAAAAAVTRVGAKVCRQMQVGIAERDWIRGVVSQIGDGKVMVKIDDAGRFPHELNGIALKRGEIVSDAATAWTPCL